MNSRDEIKIQVMAYGLFTSCIISSDSEILKNKQKEMFRLLKFSTRILKKISVLEINSMKKLFG